MQKCTRVVLSEETGSRRRIEASDAAHDAPEDLNLHGAASATQNWPAPPLFAIFRVATMRDKELRGIILEALYKHRRRAHVDFETEIGKLPAMESIVRQLEKKGLVERTFKPFSGLGMGR